MKIILEKLKCIGCGSCVSVCPQYFELTEQGKSHLKGKKINFSDNNNEELEINDKKGCIQEAIEICPMQAIYWETQNAKRKTQNLS
ncbi:ferredoxin [Patescibacteria group bacterium]|nr:ferredoxin [Patescibacteria group bacterium]